MKPITQQEAQNQIGRQRFIDQFHKLAMEEAIQKINDAIIVHWDKLTMFNTVQTQPLINCVQYARLSDEIRSLYLGTGFNVNLMPNTSVLSITLIPMQNEEN